MSPKTITYEPSDIQASIWGDSLNEQQRQAVVQSALDKVGGSIDFKSWYEETGTGKFFDTGSREYARADVKPTGTGAYAVTLEGDVRQSDPRSSPQIGTVSPTTSITGSTTTTEETGSSTAQSSPESVGGGDSNDDWEPKRPSEIMDERGLTEDDLQDVGPDTPGRTNQEIINDRQTDAKELIGGAGQKALIAGAIALGVVLWS